MPADETSSLVVDGLSIARRTLLPGRAVGVLIGLFVVGGTVFLPGDAVAHITGLLAGYALTASKIHPTKVLWLAFGGTVLAVTMIVWVT